MSKEQLLITVLFIVPGHFAWELANLFAPNNSKRTERQLGTVQLAIAIGCLFVVAALHLMTPTEFIKAASAPDFVGWGTYGSVLASVLVMGLWIILWRRWFSGEVRFVAERIFSIPYHGERFVWELVVDEVKVGRYVLVFTKDKWVYFGVLDKIPTIVADRDVYIRPSWMGKMDDEGHMAFKVDSQEPHAVFIPASEVLRITVMREPDKAVKSEPFADQHPVIQRRARVILDQMREFDAFGRTITPDPELTGETMVTQDGGD